MKKIAIIIAIILTTAVTAFSLTRNDNKAEIAKMNADKAVIANQANQPAAISTTRLATAD